MWGKVAIVISGELELLKFREGAATIGVIIDQPGLQSPKTFSQAQPKFQLGVVLLFYLIPSIARSAMGALAYVFDSRGNVHIPPEK